MSRVTTAGGSEAGGHPHVVFVSQEYAPAPPVGGVGTFTRALARALVDQGCRVTVVSCGSGAPDGVSTDEGVTVHRVPLLAPTSRLVRRLTRRAPQTAGRLVLAWSAARAIRRLGLQPDIVEAPEWGAEALFVRRAGRAPVIVHLHSPMYTLWHRRGTPLTRDERVVARLERLAATRADAITAGAPVANEVGDGSHWLPPERIRIVPMPADRELLARSEGAWPRDPVLVACGRLDRLKAPEVLIRAAAKLRPDYPRLRVVLIGEADRRDAPRYDDYGAWVAEIARDLGVPVDLAGRLPWPTVVEQYLAANVVVVPSRYETFSMVALEAMACATPVVVTSACGIAAHLREIGSGWVVPPDDPSALADALRPLLAAADDAAARGRAGRELVRQRFSPAVAAQARVALYRELLGARRAS